MKSGRVAGAVSDLGSIHGTIATRSGITRYERDECCTRWLVGRLGGMAYVSGNEDAIVSGL
jgi:hypothetical protein